MPKIIDLKQGTPEWVEYRRAGVGGSDANVIYYGKDAFGRTIQELYLNKLGQFDWPVNQWMTRGTDLEPLARAMYCLQAKRMVSPKCLEHDSDGWRRFSMDGATDDLTHGIEIKCPGRSDHNQAREGQIPDKYLPQVMRAFDFGFQTFDYVSFYEDDIAVVPVHPDPAFQAQLREKEYEFWQRVVMRLPPEQAAYEGETAIEDEQAVTLAHKYIELADFAAALERDKERIRRELIARCTAAVNTIGPVTITRSKGKRTLDQKALEAAGIDLAPFKKVGADSWKVEIKESE